MNSASNSKLDLLIALLFSTILLVVFSVLFWAFSQQQISQQWSLSNNQFDISDKLRATITDIIEKSASISLFLSLSTTLIAVYCSARNDRLSLPIRILASAENLNKFLFSAIYTLSYISGRVWPNTDLNAYFNLIFMYMRDNGFNDIAQYQQFMISLSLVDQWNLVTDCFSIIETISDQNVIRKWTRERHQLTFYCIGALAICCYLLLGMFWQGFFIPRNSKNPEFYRGTNFDKSLVNRELTNRDVFLHKAFYDLRDPAGPRIRLLVTATCDGISGDYSISVFGREIGVEWKMCTENAKFECPEPGRGCQYWHYDIGSKVYRGEIPEKITITHDGVSTEVPLHVAPGEYTDSLSACIGPLHWFNDWPRLIAFIELWRRQGTHKFLVSVQSVSKSVQQVIDYYVAKGIIETHNWPILPFSPLYDPNFKTFYVSDNLEFQHCIFWSKSKYTFLGDVDDFIYIRNHSYNYFDYMEKWLAEKSDFGALKFSHVGLTFRPRIVESPFNYENFLTFDSLRNPITFDNWRFPKTIFLTKAVKANWVHYPKEYFLGKTAYEAPKEEALHLHGRYDFDLKEDINESSKLYPDVHFFDPNQIDNVLNEIRAIVREIFHGKTPEYRGAQAHDAVESCRNTGWSAQSGCLEPGVSCFDDLFPLDDWVLAEPNKDGHYIII